MSTELTHLKERCGGCEQFGKQMTKENLFPRWLIIKTRTEQTGIKWHTKRRVPALAATLPLCGDCNKEFGNDLEAPVATLFEQIEDGQGLSDIDAELLIRWLWKMKGLSWVATNPEGKYIRPGTLRERVLYPINEIRPKLILGLCIIRDPIPPSGEIPMGIDAQTEHDAIFVSAVFSRIAVMVTFDLFEHLIPILYDRYRLAPERDMLMQQKVFFPRIGFDNGDEAVNVSIESSHVLSAAHDEHALMVIHMHENGFDNTG